MFNAEKLLGKIVGEVMGKGSGSHGGSKSMLGSLTSGSGLMTMIGLGVGAFEILKQQQGQQAQPQGMAQTPPPPPGANPFATGTPSPQPPPGGFHPPPPPPMPDAAPAAAPPVSDVTLTAPTGADLAVRLIQVMVAAAHADGVMDQAEERAVLDKLRGVELSQEEKMFLLDELHQPKSIEALTAGINNPSVAKTMYMLAVAAIETDTEAERAWLDQLARQLGLSKQIQAFIEEQR
ncbi:MAG: DUF533 domain-containing protein [Desulfobulbaceae bacterium]|nr:DUF533 domain-containing protein [Desulfobulbaceae bacterium]